VNTRRHGDVGSRAGVAERFRSGFQRARTSLESRGVLLAYLAPSLLSLIAVQTWFEPGTAIATGDLAPPVLQGPDYTSHWSDLTAGEGAPSYDIVRLPFAAWLDALNWLGFDPELGQRSWISLLFAGSAAAVVYLAFGFTTSALAAGTAGLLASFNAYRLVIGPDTIPMAAVLVAALLGGLVVRSGLRPERKQSVVAFGLASLGLGHVMANPPHVALVGVWVAACVAVVVVADPTAVRRVAGYLARAIPLALVLNAWWIVPAWLTVTGPSFGDRFAAAGVDEWAWTHERAAFANALTLNTTWAWSYPEYFPYAERLDNFPFGTLRILLPILATAGFLLARRDDRRIALALSGTALAGAWLAAGLGAPVAGINRWLYDDVPGYWLFRDPGKLLMLVLLPLAVLAGLGASRLFNARRPTLVTRVLAVGLAAGALVYVYPLFTGEVIADARPLLPSAHVGVPKAWSQAAAALNSQTDPGKVLVLPRSDYYQVPTTWGYYGAPFTGTIIRRPVLEPQPGAYFRPPPGVDRFEESIEADLASGRGLSVRTKLAALGARYILLRRDIDTAFPNRRFADPRVLGRTLMRVPGLRKFRSFGSLDIYRVDGAAGDEVFAATPIFYAGSSDDLGEALASRQRRAALVTGEDDQRSLTEAGMRVTRVIRVESERMRRLAVRAEQGAVAVRLSDPLRVSDGRRTLASVRSERIAAPLAIDMPVVVTAGSAVFRLRHLPSRWTGLGLVGLRRGESVGIWRLAASSPVSPRSTQRVGDCNAVDNRTPEELGIKASVRGSGGLSRLALSAKAHSACVTFPVARGRTSDIHTIRFRYRQAQGNPPRACLWQSGLNRCAPAPALRQGRGWRTFEATVRPHPRMTGLTLFLYADGQGRRPITVSEYQGIRLERYVLTRRSAPSSARVLREGSIAGHSLSVARPLVLPPLDLADVSVVGDCNDHEPRPPRELGLAAQVLDRSGRRTLQLAAREHSACVNYPIRAFDAGVNAYRVRFEYRRLSGSSPRVCLWQSGPDRCASLVELESDANWRVLDKTVRLDPNVRALDLFFYADGNGTGRTVTEYRDVHVEPVGSVALLGLPVQQRLPRVVAQREAPWKFRVRVSGARAPFLLGTSEAYAPGWKVSADRGDASELRHVQINGYANGWLLPWNGSYELTLEYGPERYARAALWLSLVALIGVLGWIGLRCARWFLVSSEWTRRRREQAFQPRPTGDHVRGSGGPA
jgi:arabinofuranan 3-O-arabinosyltransferase